MASSDAAAEFSAREALDCLPQAVLITDASGAIRYVNAGAERLFGARADRLCGCESAEVLRLVDERTGEALPDPVAEALADPPGPAATTAAAEPLLRVESRGESLPVRVAVGTMGEDSGAPRGAVVTIRDDTEDRMLRRAVAEPGVQDPLTRLINRAEFTQRLERMLGSGDGRHALLHLELERFGEIHDRLGDAALEYALRELTGMVSEMIRARDTFGRLGDDEFGVLMEHCRADIAEQIARSLHAILGRRPLQWRGSDIELPVSIGGLLFEAGDERPASDLLAVARRAGRRAREEQETPVRIHT